VGVAATPSPSPNFWAAAHKPAAPPLPQVARQAAAIGAAACSREVVVDVCTLTCHSSSVFSLSRRTPLWHARCCQQLALLTSQSHCCSIYQQANSPRPQAAGRSCCRPWPLHHQLFAPCGSTPHAQYTATSPTHTAQGTLPRRPVPDSRPLRSCRHGAAHHTRSHKGAAGWDPTQPAYLTCPPPACAATMRGHKGASCCWCGPAAAAG